MGDKCTFCGAKATRLCDYVCGREAAGWRKCTFEQAVKVGRESEFVEGRGLPYIDLDSNVHTCDLAICDRCATNVGIHFFPPKLGGPDTYDLCPAHKECEDWDHGRIFDPDEVEPLPDPNRFRLFKDVVIRD